MPARTVILCPLAIETRAARRAARGRASVVQCGPGPAAAARACTEALDAGAISIIVFGVAGGLLATSDLAPPVARVVDLHGGMWMCANANASAGGVTLLGVDEPVLDVPAKRELGARTGAALVDCESHAVARICAARGVRFHIIRGVSDGPESVLPPETLNWVTPEGNTRAVRAGVDLLLRPKLLPRVRTLARYTSAALDAASRLLDRLLGEKEA